MFEFYWTCWQQMQGKEKAGTRVGVTVIARDRGEALQKVPNLVGDPFALHVWMFELISISEIPVLGSDLA